MMVERWMTTLPPWLLAIAAALGAAVLRGGVVLAGTAMLTPQVFGLWPPR